MVIRRASATQRAGETVPGTEDNAVAVIKHYAIYERPRDYPNGYVVREWYIDAGTITPGEARTAPSLEAARALLPSGVEKVPNPESDPAILEVWM